MHTFSRYSWKAALLTDICILNGCEYSIGKWWYSQIRWGHFWRKRKKPVATVDVSGIPTQNIPDTYVYTLRLMVSFLCMVCKSKFIQFGFLRGTLSIVFFGKHVHNFIILLYMCIVQNINRNFYICASWHFSLNGWLSCLCVTFYVGIQTCITQVFLAHHATIFYVIVIILAPSRIWTHTSQLASWMCYPLHRRGSY